MNIRRKLIGAGLIVFSLVTVFSVYARPGFGGRHHHGHHGGGFPFGILKQLDLTEQQQTQIDAILKAHWETVAPLKKEMHTLHSSVISKLLSPGTISADDFTAENERAAQLHTQLFPSHVAVGLEIRNVLTESQRTRAAELIAQKQAEHAERGHHRWEKEEQPTARP